MVFEISPELRMEYLCVFLIAIASLCLVSGWLALVLWYLVNVQRTYKVMLQCSDKMSEDIFRAPKILG